MPDVSHPVFLTRDQLRFEIHRAFQQIRQADRRATTFKDLTKAERAWDAMVETVLKRSDDLKVNRLDAEREPFDAIAVLGGRAGSRLHRTLDISMALIV